MYAMSLKRNSRNIDYKHKEILKCAKDPIYFMNKYVKIQHPTKGALPFATYPFQDQCVADFRRHKFNVVLKARQLGLSTVTAGYALWMFLFRQNSNILVIATKLSVAKNFMNKCKYMLDKLPSWLILGEITGKNAQSITSDKGCVLKAVPTSEDAGRSEALSLLIVDEAAFVKNFDDLWKGLFPTLTEGGSAIILSTPNGTHSKFYDIYHKAEKNENNFNPIKLPWSVHPNRDEKWFKKETRGLTLKEIAQEYECDFIASGDTYLDPIILQGLREMIKNPIRKAGEDRNVWIWEEPKAENKYILSADTARGDGKDYSTFHIIDVDEGEVVVEYQGKFRPDRFAELINEFGLLYNKALVCPENNSVGYATIQRLCGLLYPRIYNNKQKSLNIWGGNSKELSMQKPSGDLGVFTTGNQKNIILTKLEEILRNDRIKIYSYRLYEELKTFVWLTNHKVGAERSKNDDLVMSLAIGLWLFETCDHVKYDKDYGKELIENISKDVNFLEDMIYAPNKKDDFSVILPMGGGSSYGSGMKKAQVLNNKWKWIMD